MEWDEIYGLSIKDNKVGDINKSQGLMNPKLVGILKASTFTGMCGYHDDATFAQIEKNPIVACPEHAFLLAYRHICTELFTKRAGLNLFEHLRTGDRGRSILDQMSLQSLVDDMEHGYRLGLKDVETLKANYDKALQASDFSQVSYYAIRFNEVPDVMCCSGNFPEYDFAGNDLGRRFDLPEMADHASLSVLGTDTGGFAVFTWLGNNPASERLVKSLYDLNDAAVPNAIIRHLFEYSENSYISPVWWDGLADDKKMALRTRITNSANVQAPRLSNCLMDDGHAYVKWTLSGRETNIVM